MKSHSSYSGKPVRTLIVIVSLGLFVGRCLATTSAFSGTNVFGTFSSYSDSLSVPSLVKVFLTMMLTAGGYALRIRISRPEEGASPIFNRSRTSAIAATILLPMIVLGGLSVAVYLLGRHVAAVGLLILACSPIANSSIGWAHLGKQPQHAVRLATFLLLASWTIPIAILFAVGNRHSEAFGVIASITSLSVTSFLVGICLRAIVGEASRIQQFAKAIGRWGLFGLNFCAAFHLGAKQEIADQWFALLMGVLAPTCCCLVATVVFSKQHAVLRPTLIRAATMKNTGLTTAVAMATQTAINSLANAIALMLAATIVQHILAAQVEELDES